MHFVQTHAYRLFIYNHKTVGDGINYDAFILWNGLETYIETQKGPGHIAEVKRNYMLHISYVTYI